MNKTELEKRIEEVKDVHQIQMSPGNGEYDEYMTGMANGLELAVSILENREPKYVSFEPKELNPRLVNEYMNTHVYLVQNKADDYNNCRTELVETTFQNAGEYYKSHQVREQDVDVLKNYFDLVEYDEEKERDNDTRFYGGY